MGAAGGDGDNTEVLGTMESGCMVQQRMGTLQATVETCSNTLSEQSARFTDACPGYDANQLGFFATVQSQSLASCLFEEPECHKREDTGKWCNDNRDRRTNGYK